MLCIRYIWRIICFVPYEEFLFILLIFYSYEGNSTYIYEWRCEENTSHWIAFRACTYYIFTVGISTCSRLRFISIRQSGSWCAFNEKAPISRNFKLVLLDTRVGLLWLDKVAATIKLWTILWTLQYLLLARVCKENVVLYEGCWAEVLAPRSSGFSVLPFILFSYEGKDITNMKEEC
jgi:hypothetical protein